MKIVKMRLMTPREIGRLMGVKDDDITTMINTGLSNDSLCNSKLFSISSCI